MPSVDVDSGRARFRDIIEARADQQPDKIFMWIDRDACTYGEFRHRVNRAAHALLRLGVGPGHVVASFGRTSFDALAMLFAASYVGGVYMPINTQYKGEYLRHQLRDSRATVLLTDADLVDRVEGVIDDLPDLRTLVIAHGAPTRTSLAHAALVGVDLLDAVIPSGAVLPEPTPWNEPAFLFYTSGTTGVSKGALLTQHNLITSAGLFNSNYGIRPDDIQYAAVPLFHISGAYTSVITVLVGGRTGVLDSAFHVSTCWQRIRELGATVFFGVGAMALMLWKLPPSPDDASLPIRLMLTAPVPTDLWPAIEARYQCEILTGYGQTEIVMLSQMVAGQNNVPGSCGKPLDIYEVRIVDDDDADVPRGESGEIVVRPKISHAMFEGYVGRPETTLAQMRNLWFHTGDLGRFDDAGNLYFVDRKKDAIRRRGENISSFEVERAVLEFSAVRECAAYAVPSPLGEDEVMVAIVATDGDFDFEAFAGHCAHALPRFARPRYVEVVDVLPKSATGRVQKHALRAVGFSERTWDSDLAGFTALSTHAKEAR